jgi:hypothetical protein
MNSLNQFKHISEPNLTLRYEAAKSDARKYAKLAKEWQEYAEKTDRDLDKLYSDLNFMLKAQVLALLLLGTAIIAMFI